MGIGILKGGKLAFYNANKTIAILLTEKVCFIDYIYNDPRFMRPRGKK